jgi:arylsulfatase A-like enzyme
MDWNSLRKAKKFLKSQVKKGAGKNVNPFFLYFSLVLPHPPYMTHANRLKKINLDAISLPKSEQFSHPVINFQKMLKNWGLGFEPEIVKRTRGVYYAMIAETDQIIGELVQTMKDLKIYDDTYLIITADHGDNQLEHGQSLKSNMFESAAKVPLLIRGPNLEKGKMCSVPVDTTDLFPTILDFARIPKENLKERYQLDFELDGESLYPLCISEKPNEGNQRKKDFAFSMYTGVGTNTSQFMLRQGDWKYWVFPGYQPLLFNISKDIDEIIDFSKENPKVVADMDKKLREIVDYEDVHKKHIEYCRRSLIEFEEKCNRGEISFRKGKKIFMKVGFEDVLKFVYKGWGEDQSNLLRQFMLNQ